MRNQRKKCSAWLLAIVLLLSLIPTAHAAEQGYTVKVTASKTEELMAGDTVTLTAAVTKNGEAVTDLTAEGLKLWFWPDIWQAGHENGLGTGDNAVSPSDGSGDVLSVNFTLPEAGTYYLAAQLQKDGEQLAIDFATLTTIAADAADAPAPIDAGIFVDYIPGTDGDFIRGADVSILLSNLNAGARYSDFDGKSLGATVEEQGANFMKLLAESGFNWIRLRVWNDPYDSDGNGYGGGNNNVDVTKIIGKWATDAGLRVLVDFHYSDFWADPGKQMVPKAWADMDIATKAAALEKFTDDSLNALITAGVDVGMVQVGNETNGHICGESEWDNMVKLFSAGSRAVRSVDEDILVALHFTNPETGDRYANYAKDLDTAGVDYDVFASSYYPSSHGTPENLTAVLKHVADTYGKKVMAVETSWQWTETDGDGTGGGGLGENPKYPASVQGQADEMVDVIKAVKAIGEAGIGVCYWEPAWIPVRNVTGLTGAAYDAQVAENKALWEKYGAGWASSFATEYDPEDAGVWYGGSSMDVSAYFDFDGKPLESLKIFQYVQTGAVTERVAVRANNVALNCYVGEKAPALPETVSTIFNDRSTETQEVTWKQTEAAAVDTSKAGTYTVTGMVGTNTPVTCTITVSYPNLLQNPSLEDEDVSMYTISDSNTAFRNNENPYEGNYGLHFWSADPVAFTAEQKITLQPGNYTFTFQGQGGDMGANAETYAYVKFIEGGKENTLTDGFSLTGWLVWDAPEISFTLKAPAEVTVGASVTAGAGAWGTLDNWYLYSTGSTTADASYTDIPTGSWYAEAVTYVTEMGLMTGISETDFAPNSQLTWAVVEAADLSVPANVNGTAAVTREDMIKALYQAMPDSGKGPAATEGDLLRFVDRDQISEDAYAAVNWAVNQAGFVTGRTADTLAPQAIATRAEFAVVLQRFYKLLEG